MSTINPILLQKILNLGTPNEEFIYDDEISEVISVLSAYLNHNENFQDQSQVKELYDRLLNLSDERGIR